MSLTEAQSSLLLGKNFAHLATLGPDGAPQVTPVWIDWDGTHVLVNTEQKRAKTRNLERNPRVSLAVSDAANPYRYVEVRGRVVSISAEGADEHIDKLAEKYMGRKYPFNQPGDVRVIVRIEPTRVLGMG